MTIAGWPVLLGAIVVDASNNKIKVTQNAVTEVLTIASGTYYLRGDEAAGDFKVALTTALGTHSGGDTYSATLSVDESSGQRSMRLTIARATGSHSFSILWNDAATTFDQSLIGFADAATASGTSCTTTLSPRACWVSDEVMESFEPSRRRVVHANPAKSGIVKGGERSDPMVMRTLVLQMIGEDRTHQSAIAADTARAWDSFLDYVGASIDFEAHLVDLSGGLTVSPLSSSTEIDDRWTLSEESAGAFEPERLEPGLALYDWSVTMHAVVD